MRPEIEVVRDYEGYFEALVKKWVDKKEELGIPFKSKKIVITSGPYRPDAVTCKRAGDMLHIDFYAALRAGFGSLHDIHVNAIIYNWL